jgi:hypothetical protein
MFAASILRATTLTIKTASTFVTSVNIDQTTRGNNPDSSHLRTRRLEKLKCHK